MTSKASSALPFANTVGDSLELMKKMWGIAGLPGMPNAGQMASMAMRLPQQLPSMVAPTFDISELDRRIADLRAVEQWLELNTGMLRTAIQTLEVQRATIATLKGISGAMLAPLGKAPARPESATTAAAPTAVAASSAAPAGPPRKAVRKRPKAKPQPAPSLTDAPLNPSAWWNTLQDQFTKIAATAAATGSTTSAKTAAPPSKQRSRRKT
jgi:hypothetical protein